jgi:UDP-N-acetylmuramoylalanine--D-glutamate ligase
MGVAFFGVLEFQTYNSFIVASDIAIDMLKKYGEFQPRAKMLRTNSGTIPSDWNIDVQNTHVRENTALAVETAKIFKIDPDAIHLALTQMKPMKGRIERLKSVKGHITFYNDTMSVRPEATLAALRALGEHDAPTGPQNHRGTVLVIGGAYTGASYKDLFAEIPQYVSSVIVLPGSGTLTERAGIEGLKEKDVKVLYVKNLVEAAENIKFLASKGDVVLFSPGFDVTGQYESRQARGEEFVEAVKAAK